MQQEPGHIGKLVQTEILLLKVRRLESGWISPSASFLRYLYGRKQVRRYNRTPSAMMQMMPDAESFSSAVNVVRGEQAIFFKLIDCPLFPLEEGEYSSRGKLQ